MKVAIVAGGHGKYDAPLDSPDWECWGLNSTWYQWGQSADTRFHRWFELHRRSFLTWEHGGETNSHFSWMRTLTTLPVYVQDPADWVDMPTVRAFPFACVAALVPSFAYYHCCSIDWMVALAIAEGAEEIGLYGVEQQHTAEPVSSRACVEFWCGVAAGRGIAVHSDEGSTFRAMHMVHTKIPYALDPAWLPWEDRANENSAMAQAAARLQLEVDLATRKGHP